MTKTMIFTWDYYGWGNHTPQLVEAVDAVERSRGFEPSLFVDIRIRRTVRAKGFQGNAFVKLLGQDRHRWMKTLGNKFIQTRTGPTIQIASLGQSLNFSTLPLTWPNASSGFCSSVAASGPAARARSTAIELPWPSLS